MDNSNHFSLNIPLVEGRFIRRSNRFVVYVEINGEEYGASLPNPGKMQELLFPKTTLLLTPMDMDRVKYPFRVEGIITDRGETIMLNTVKTNDCAAWLVENGKVPSLKGWNLVRREITVGDSRFDLLLEKDGENLYCEVKSCTLFGGELCMFPDAVTDRGRRHVQELGDMARAGIKTAVLFLVHSSLVKSFSPDYHTDPAFSQTLYENRHDIVIIPMAIGWNATLSLTGEMRELPIRWDLFEIHGSDDAGHVLFMIELDRDHLIDCCPFGEQNFSKGFYISIESVQNGLAKRIEQLRRIRKSKTSPFEYLREQSTVAGVWPIRSKNLAPEQLHEMCASIASRTIAFTNQTLFYFETNPTRTRNLQHFLTKVRMEIV